MNNSFFITGTDTNIGKTEITCGLIEFFKKKGNDELKHFNSFYFTTV